MYEKMAHANEWGLETAPLKSQWQSTTTYDEIAARASEIGTSPALSFQMFSGEKDKAVTYNWEELRARVAQCANGLRKMGIGEKDVVAYLLPNCMEAVVINQGGATAGIVNPVNPLISAEHIGGILHETGAKVLVTMAPFPKSDVAQIAVEALEHAPNVNTVLTVDLLGYLTGLKKLIVPLIRPKVNWPEHVEVKDFNAFCDAEPVELEFEPSKKDRPAAYFHTGGTTGRPKVAQHLQSGMLYNGWLGAELIFKPDDVVICPLPMFHVFAAYPILMSCICSGAHMVMITPQGYRGEGVFDNFWKLVERWKVSFMIMVPTAAARLMQTPLNADVSSLRLAVCGSAPLPQGLFDRFEEVTGVRILEGYGMTEATCLVAVNPIEGDRRVGSVGYPLPYTDVKILHCDADGNVVKKCKVDEIGEICVSNPGVYPGKTYVVAANNKGLFAEKNYLRTGDLGRIDKNGVLWITGRAKDLIIRGGHNIDPAMIEDALAKNPNVAFVGAIGQPDAHAGELPAAYVELCEDSKITVDELMAFAEAEVPERAAVPKYIEIMPELPKTAVGKVFKPDLRKSAIARVLNGEFESSGMAVKVESVVEDKKRGLVAELKKTGDVKDADIKKMMGKYSVKYEMV